MHLDHIRGILAGLAVGGEPDRYNIEIVGGVTHLTAVLPFPKTPFFNPAY